MTLATYHHQQSCQGMPKFPMYPAEVGGVQDWEKQLIMCPCNQQWVMEPVSAAMKQAHGAGGVIEKFGLFAA